MSIVSVPPVVNYAITVITTAVGLLATQGLIDNHSEKLVAGLAAILIPAAYLLFVACLHLAHARVTAARITAGEPTTPRT